LKRQYLLSLFTIILIIILFCRLNLFIANKTIKWQREKALKKGRNYLNKCLEGVIKNTTFTISNNPKISVIVPVYNSQKQ